MKKTKGRHPAPSRPAPARDTPPKLTPKQQAFADEYLLDLNAKQAAIRAGYSAKVAETNGPRLLRNAQVAAYVSKRQAERLQTNDLDVNRVLEEVRRLAFADPRAYFNGGGKPRQIGDLTAEEAAPLTFEIRHGKKGATVKFKLPPKNKALEQLARRFGLGAPDPAAGFEGVSLFSLPPGTKVKVEP